MTDSFCGTRTKILRQQRFGGFLGQAALAAWLTALAPLAACAAENSGREGKTTLFGDVEIRRNRIELSAPQTLAVAVAPQPASLPPAVDLAAPANHAANDAEAPAPAAVSISDFVGPPRPKHLTAPAPVTETMENTESAPSVAVVTESVAPAAESATAAPDESSLSVREGVTTLQAERIHGQRFGELMASGDVEIQRADLHLRADELRYDELQDRVSATGNVRVRNPAGLTITGPSADITLYTRSGEIHAPHYCYEPAEEARAPTLLEELTGKASRPSFSGEGHAQSLRFEGENHYRLERGTWSTCRGPDPDWYIRADDLQLDFDRSRGEVEDSVLVFKNTPILWWPWAKFPLDSRRQSGFLAPTVTLSSRKGVDLSVPYYWNIAPNYDATLTPRLLTRRGMMLGAEYRYLTRQYGSGTFRGEWMPDDRKRGSSRALGSWQHLHALLPGLAASVDFNAVSDAEYFDDISSQVQTSALTHLSRNVALNYTGGGWWQASLQAQAWQTLGAENYASAPYQKMPEFALTANRALPSGLRFTLDSTWTDFDLQHRLDNLARGTRLYAYPQIGWDFERPEGFLKPRIGINYTRYNLDNQPIQNGRTEITRSLPVFSLDSGLFFDRYATWRGRDFRQTLEPRLFYVYAPYRDQDDIPLFDTARYDFGMAQIFSENRYAGKDRFADSNQVTLALTSRLIEEASGAERLQLMLGQRYYFADRKVLLPREKATQSNRSDLLAQVRGELGYNVSVSSSLQYNLDDRRSERYNVGIRYLPAAGKTLAAGYRYANDVLHEVDVAAQWPVFQNWLLVGRVSRSIMDDRVTDAIGGLEYNAGCWRVRTAVHHYTTTNNKVNNTFFVQLELNGLGALGTNPVDLLRRRVPGYGQIGSTLDNPAF